MGRSTFRQSDGEWQARVTVPRRATTVLALASAVFAFAFALVGGLYDAAAESDELAIALWGSAAVSLLPLIVSAWVWNVIGEEVVRLSDGLLILERSPFGLLARRAFPVESVRQLRVTRPRSPAIVGPVLAWANLAGETIVFQSDGRSHRFGIALRPAEARDLVIAVDDHLAEEVRHRAEVRRAEEEAIAAKKRAEPIEPERAVEAVERPEAATVVAMPLDHGGAWELRLAPPRRGTALFGLGLAALGSAGAVAERLYHAALASDDLGIVLLSSAAVSLVPLIASSWVWNAIGEEVVRVSGGTLTLDRAPFGLLARRAFPVESVRKLRVADPRPATFVGPVLAWANLAGGTIVFESGGRDHRFGIALPPAEARNVAIGVGERLAEEARRLAEKHGSAEDAARGAIASEAAEGDRAAARPARGTPRPSARAASEDLRDPKSTGAQRAG